MWMRIAQKNQKYGQAGSGSAVSGQLREPLNEGISAEDGRKTESSEGAFSLNC